VLPVGVVVQVAIAGGLAVLLAVAGRAAEAAGRALRQPPRHPEPISLPVPTDQLAGWPSRLLAAGLGSRAPPCTSIAR